MIDGAVRDSQDIIAAGFPVFTRGVCIRKTTKVQNGEINVPVTIGGQLVHPGDIILGDADGLVVIPAAELDQAIQKAQERERKEERIRERIREEATTLELLGLPLPR